MNKRAVILRGLPGSGKSTFAAKLSGLREDVHIFNADSFHMVNGEYKYRPEMANKAHLECLKNFTLSAIMGQEMMIVDNTNTSSFQMIPYIKIAEAFGHQVWIIEMKCSILDSIKRNIHKVPEETICKMAMGLSHSLPADWGDKYQFRCLYPEWFGDEKFLDSVLTNDGWYK